MKVPLDVRVGYVHNIPDPGERVDWKLGGRGVSLELIELHDDKLLTRADIGKAIHVPSSLGRPGRACVVGEWMLGVTAAEAVDGISASRPEEAPDPGGRIENLARWLADGAGVPTPLDLDVVYMGPSRSRDTYDVVLLDDRAGRVVPAVVVDRGQPTRSGQVTGFLLVKVKGPREPAVAIVRTLSSAQVADLIGGSRHDVNRMRIRRCLLAVRDKGRFTYPAFQFQDGKVVPGMDTLIRAADHLRPADLNYVLVNEDEDGSSPVNLLRAGDQVGALDLMTRRASGFRFPVSPAAAGLVAELDADLEEAPEGETGAVSGHQ